MCTAHDACADCAITALVHAHRAALVRVARAEGIDGEDALDVVQDAFAAYLARGGSPQPLPSLRAFTRNLARNRRRLHAHARPHGPVDAVAAEGVDPDAQLDAHADAARLDACVAALGDAQRAVVRLRLLEDRPGSDVARQLGLTPGHVAVLLHRARAALAVCLGVTAAGIGT